jgi:hypothetical protein
MNKFVPLLAIAFVLSISSVEAAKKKPQVTAAGSAPVQTAGPAKHTYSRNRGSAAWLPSGAGCKMSGRC